MRRIQDEVRELVSIEGLVVRKDHKKLSGAIDWLVRRRELRAVLPGIYGPVESEDDRLLRLKALWIWAPDAVLTGRTAAQVSFWPDLSVPTIECAIPRQRDPQPGFTIVRRVVPPDLVAEGDGLRWTKPALTALDLCASEGSDGIDLVLRQRLATLAQLRAALELTGGRRANRQRRALLLDSRDEPWSAAERKFHRLLRENGITGWRANRPVTADGTQYWVDVLFRRLRLVVEIDGRRFHDDNAEGFESDRLRQNALVLEGWTVLRFTWRMIEDDPEQVLAVLRRALEAAK